MKASWVLLWKFQSTACGNWERGARSAESKVGPTDPHFLVSLWDPLWYTDMHPHPTRGWHPHQTFSMKVCQVFAPTEFLHCHLLPTMILINQWGPPLHWKKRFFRQQILILFCKLFPLGPEPNLQLVTLNSVQLHFQAILQARSLSTLLSGVQQHQKMCAFLLKSWSWNTPSIRVKTLS